MIDQGFLEVFEVRVPFEEEEYAVPAISVEPLSVGSLDLGGSTLGDLPIEVRDGQLVPLVSNTGIYQRWPFIDRVTGQIVFLRIRDGQLTLNDE